MTKKSISALAGLGGVSENDSELARSWSVRFDRLMILCIGTSGLLYIVIAKLVAEIALEKSYW